MAASVETVVPGAYPRAAKEGKRSTRDRRGGFEVATYGRYGREDPILESAIRAVGGHVGGQKDVIAPEMLRDDRNRL
jgi:hypothetical protein